MIWYKAKYPQINSRYEDWVAVNSVYFNYEPNDFGIFDIKLEDKIYTEETPEFTARYKKLEIWLKLL